MTQRAKRRQKRQKQLAKQRQPEAVSLNLWFKTEAASRMIETLARVRLSECGFGVMPEIASRLDRIELPRVNPLAEVFEHLRTECSRAMMLPESVLFGTSEVPVDRSEQSTIRPSWTYNTINWRTSTQPDEAMQQTPQPLQGLPSVGLANRP